MDTLFPIAPVFPEGFSYFPGFISKAEEDELVAAISLFELQAFKFQGFEAKRKTASFGYDYHFDQRSLARGEAIPEVFSPLISRVAEKLGMHPDVFAELLLTEYPPGSVINWHRDAPPFELIAGISLLSDCTFRFRPHEESRRSRRSLLLFTAERRSLYVMRGPSRSAWQHSIAPVKDTRYSITLRTLKSIA